MKSWLKQIVADDLVSPAQEGVVPVAPEVAPPAEGEVTPPTAGEWTPEQEAIVAKVDQIETLLGLEFKAAEQEEIKDLTFEQALSKELDEIIQNLSAAEGSVSETAPVPAPEAEGEMPEAPKEKIESPADVL